MENRLFASAKKIDDRLTMITGSSFSDESAKTPHRITGPGRSGSKKSFLSSQRLSINIVISEMVSPSSKERKSDLSLLIESNTAKVDDRVETESEESSISVKESLELYSEIEEMDESVENGRRELNEL